MDSGSLTNHAPSYPGELVGRHPADSRPVWAVRGEATRQDMQLLSLNIRGSMSSTNVKPHSRFSPKHSAETIARTLD